MLTLERFKRLLAILILMCFFLPIAQCTAKAPISNHEISEKISATEVFIPVAVIQFKEIDELIIIAIFVWPLVISPFRWRVHTAKREMLVNFIELIFSAASIVYLVLVFHFWGDVLYGGIIVLSAFTAYLLTCGFVLYRHAIRKFV